MAKRNKIYIDVVIDDKGTTKKVALSQKQLADAAQAAGVQVGTVDRRLKGAAQGAAGQFKDAGSTLPPELQAKLEMLPAKDRQQLLKML